MDVDREWWLRVPACCSRRGRSSLRCGAWSRRTSRLAPSRCSRSRCSRGYGHARHEHGGALPVRRSALRPADARICRSPRRRLVAVRRLLHRRRCALRRLRAGRRHRRLSARPARARVRGRPARRSRRARALARSASRSSAPTSSGAAVATPAPRRSCSAATLGFSLWALALLLVGVRTVHGWSWWLRWSLVWSRFLAGFDRVTWRPLAAAAAARLEPSLAAPRPAAALPAASARTYVLFLGLAAGAPVNAQVKACSNNASSSSGIARRCAAPPGPRSRTSSTYSNDRGARSPSPRSAYCLTKRGDVTRRRARAGRARRAPGRRSATPAPMPIVGMLTARR